MRRVEVGLGDRAYEIVIGRGLRAQWDVLEGIARRMVVVVTNTTVAPLYLDDVRRQFDARGIAVIPAVLPDGEEYKDWPTLNRIFDTLLASHCERKTPLIALGGGVIGDMTGFAAACYQRGAPFVQMPTTLLSQVDSSVGGKTAINHPLGKNMIGAFYQPKKVIIDVDTLSTLPDREVSAGLAEVIKYGLIRDPGFFSWIEANIDALRAKDPDALTEAIERSCRNKAEVVIADEMEQGERALLNLGHTFGHAIETGMGYGAWLHGEAVAAGTVMAADLSARLGWISRADVRRIEDLFLRAGLPVHGPADLPPERYLQLMAHDKKVVDGRLRLILLRGIGNAVVHSDAPGNDIRAAIQARSTPQA
jgi:3-dehydroquinate synthase